MGIFSKLFGRARSTPLIDAEGVGPGRVPNSSAPISIDTLLRALDDSEHLKIRGDAYLQTYDLEPDRAVGLLIGALRNGDPIVRRCAANLLGEFGDPRALDPLIDRLGDADEDVRIMCARVLGTLGEKRAVEPLTKMLEDRSSMVRGWAADGLGMLGAASAFERLAEVIPDAIRAQQERSFECRLLCRALGALGDPQGPYLPTCVFEALVEAMRQDHAAAGDALIALGDARASELVLNLLCAVAPSGTSHWRANISERGFGDVLAALSPNLDGLQAALSHSKAAVRRTAAYALGKRRESGGVEPLIKALGDENTDVASSAARALGEIGDPRAYEPLVRSLNASSSRHAHAYALGRLGDPRAVDTLIGLLTYRQAMTPPAAAIALGRIRDPRAFDPLVALLSNRDGAGSAIEALGMLGDSRALDHLVKYLSVLGFERTAMKSLGDLGDRRAVKYLVPLVGRGNYHKEAATALGKLGGPKALEALLKANSEFRAGSEAADALARFGDDRCIEPLMRMSLHHEMAALKALCVLNHPRTVRTLRRALRFPEIRAEAMAALARGRN